LFQTSSSLAYVFGIGSQLSGEREIFKIPNLFLSDIQIINILLRGLVAISVTLDKEPATPFISLVTWGVCFLSPQKLSFPKSYTRKIEPIIHSTFLAMSTELKLHDDTLSRVYQLSSPELALAELHGFLARHFAMVILGDFPDSDVYISSINMTCEYDGPTFQAALWVKKPELIAAVKPTLQSWFAAYSQADFDNVLAMTFKPYTAQVVYHIDRNPTNPLKIMSDPEIYYAFNEAINSANGGTTS
jgi:hypothetical protein